jgi:hypothetical protein
MVKTKKRPYTKGLVYDGEFRGLKDLSLEECKQCWFYEFARERPDYRAGITAWRRQKEVRLFLAQLQELAIFGARFPQMKEWPDVPFLEIGHRKLKSRIPKEAAKLLPWPNSSPDAAELLKLLDDQKGHLIPQGLEQLKNCLAILAFNQEQVNQGIELCGWPIVQLGVSPALVTLSIPWGRSDTELKDSFAVLVKYLRRSLAERFGKDFLPEETRGRNRKDRILEDLKALEGFRKSGQGTRFADQRVFAQKRQLAKAVLRVKEILRNFPRSNPGATADYWLAYKWLRIEDAVRVFGISRSKLYQLINNRRIKSFCLRERNKLKGIRLINFDSVYAFMEGEAAAQEVAAQEAEHDAEQNG